MAVSLEDEINLALSNSKRVQREARIVVQDLARLRDHYLEIEQSEEDTSHDQHREQS